jgi:DNA-directed RNA polymerase specialized sigma24 family protein
MAKENIVTQEKFDLLLSWLDRNRETAGQKYEKIRQRLIRILIGRGCFEAEQLADETFDRVTRKLPELAGNYTGEPSLYFYGVADKIYLEWLRQQKKIKQLRLPQNDARDKTALEIEYECLETCLEKLSAEQHRLIVGYYKEEKPRKSKIAGSWRNFLELRQTRCKSNIANSRPVKRMYAKLHCRKKFDVKGFTVFCHNITEQLK